VRRPTGAGGAVVVVVDVVLVDEVVVVDRWGLVVGPAVEPDPDAPPHDAATTASTAAIGSRRRDRIT
jgi:hypothetical protein